MAGTVSKLELQPLNFGRKDWLLPLVGTAASIAFAAALSTTLRVVRGFAKAREAAFDPPQAILVLGGDKEREFLAAKFAASCGERSFTRLVQPESHAAGLRLLPVYVSSGYDDVATVMLHAGVHPSRIRIDNRALDTVTNFTTMLTTFIKAEYTHIYLVTSDYHIARAKMIATLVFCSHGIAFTAVVLPTGRKQMVWRSAKGASELDLPSTRKEFAIRPVPRPGRRLENSTEALSAHSPSEQSKLSEDVDERQAGGKASSNSVLESSSARSGLPRPSTLSKDSVFGSKGNDRQASGEGLPQVVSESWVRQERDRMRTLLWMMTGWHGAELLRFTRPTRYRLHKQKPLHPEIDAKDD